MWSGVYIKEYRPLPLPHQRILDAEAVGAPTPKEPRENTVDIVSLLLWHSQHLLFNESCGQEKAKELGVLVVCSSRIVQ